MRTAVPCQSQLSAVCMPPCMNCATLRLVKNRSIIYYIIRFDRQAFLPWKAGRGYSDANVPEKCHKIGPAPASSVNRLHLRDRWQRRIWNSCDFCFPLLHHNVVHVLRACMHGMPSQGQERTSGAICPIHAVLCTSRLTWAHLKKNSVLSFKNQLH